MSFSAPVQALLTSLCDSMSAIILQIKLAISNLDPFPARLAKDWDRDYSVSEALVGYKRAAATHGWQVCISRFFFVTFLNVMNLSGPHRHREIGPIDERTD